MSAPLTPPALAASNVRPIDSVRKQPALSNINRVIIDRRYIVSGSRQYGLRAAAEHETVVRHDDEAALWLAPKRGYGRFDFGIAMNGRCDRLHFERSGGGLE
jgi:hypothetical protein